MLAYQTPTRDTQAPVATGTAVVTGTVLGGPDGSDPARKARVMLNSVDGRVPGQTVATGDDGAFEFRNVPGGRYTITVQKAGYLNAAYGATRPGRAGTPVSVADGASISGLAIRLFRGAAISGIVRDGRGRPLPGVTVSAFRYDVSPVGERVLAQQRNETTDDQGAYRLWGLPAGDYLVAAILGAPGSYGLFPSNDFAALTSADVDRALQAAPSTAGPQLQQQPVPTATYAPVFHPASTDLARAATVSVVSGDDRGGIDIIASLVRTARIEGVVTMPDGQPSGPARVSLGVAGESGNVINGVFGWRPRQATIDKQGRFTFSDVPPGKYTLTALSNVVVSVPRSWAIADVSVDGADLAVSLTMQPPMKITGRVIFDGASPPPSNITILNLRFVPPGGGAVNSGPGGPVNADRTFDFGGVTPGEFRLWLVKTAQAAWGWWPRSAIVNGQDLLDGPLRVAPGENPELVLTYTDRPSEISGQFQDTAGRPAPDYFIVIFPADRARWTPGSRRIMSTRPANDGRYAMRGLPPGDYLLAALTDLDAQDLNTPAFFDELIPLAVKITLAEGVVTKQDLRVGK